jgi:putative tryptophan/tyrosine transport system substrate-binding protein
MRRREFIAGLASAAVSPLAARAQRDGRMRHVGVLMPYAEANQDAQARLQAFRQRLVDFGWVEGREVRIDVRWAGPDAARQRSYARELVALAPDVILTGATTTAQALREATQAIPIVFVTLSDPVGSGLVSNLARPDANVTGFMQFEYSMAGKWLSLLKDAAPRLGRAAVLFNPNTLPFGPSYVRAAQEVGERLAIKVNAAAVHDAAAIEPTIAAMASSDDGGGGVVGLPDVFFADNMATIVGLAARYRVPVIYAFRVFAEHGGLMAYGTDQQVAYRDGATYVDRILRGTKVADLPVQFATKFEFIINLKTAKALGLTIPETLLATADEVIQ